MASARETFLHHIEEPDVDPIVSELRGSLISAKQEAMEQVEGLDEAGLKLVMPGLYEQTVISEIQIAAHVGLAVGLALSCMDEHYTGASISRFTREIRQQMTEMGVALKKRHSSRIAKLVAEIEAQRLAWRHNHEFLSWLAFRRGDERYPPDSRRERLDAFKVQQRLLQTREVMIGFLGLRLSAAVEGCDRFLLANRWRLPESPESAIERYAWPLLSFQSAAAVEVERGRLEYDALMLKEAPQEQIEAQHDKIGEFLKQQLAEALDRVPSSALAGAT